MTSSFAVQSIFDAIKPTSWLKLWVPDVRYVYGLIFVWPRVAYPTQFDVIICGAVFPESVNDVAALIK